MSVEQLPPKKPRATTRDAKFVHYDEYIDTQISSTRRLVKAVDATTVLLTMAVGTLMFLLAAAVVEHWFVTSGFSFLTRTILFASLFSALGYYALKRLWPLIFRPINPVYAAHTIEQGSPSLKNSLLNLLLFRQQRDEITDAVYETLEEQAAQRLTRAPVESAVDRTYLLRLGYVLVGMVLLSALYKIASPKDPLITAQRVLMPWADVVPASRVTISNIEPGTTTLARGQVLTVAADVQGIGDDDPVVVRYTTTDGQAVDKSVQLQPDSAGLRFSGQVPAHLPGAPTGIAQDLRYRIEAGDARSLEYRINVVATPTITVERIDYDYPDYTGFADRQVDNLGDIRAIEGTKVTIHARANEPIEEASVDFEADGRRDLPMTVDDTQAQTPLVLALRDDRQTPKFTSYVLRFTSIDGRKNSDPVKFAIDVLPDYLPEASISAPRDKIRDVRLGDTVAIDVEARDPDFALSEVRLIGDVAGRKVVDQPLLAAEQSGKFTGRYVFDPREHKLHPGDVMQYRVTARDNRRPQIEPVASEPQALRIISPDPNRQPPPDRVAQRDKPNQQQPNNQPQPGQQQGEQQQDGQGGDSGQQSGEQASKESSDSQGNEQQGESASNTGERGQAAEGQSGNEKNSDQNQSNAGDEQNSDSQSKSDSRSQTGDQAGDQSQQQSGENQSGGDTQGSGEQSTGQKGNQSGNQSGNQQQPSGNNSGGKGGEQSGDSSQQPSNGGQPNGQSGQQRGNPRPSAEASGAQSGNPQSDGAKNGQRAQKSQSATGQNATQQQAGKEGQQQGSKGESPTDDNAPVSPDGDNDGEAFERIQKFLEKQDQSKPTGNSQESGGKSDPNANDAQGENSEREAKGAKANQSESKESESGDSASAEGKTGEKSGANTRDGDPSQKSQQQPEGGQKDSQSPGGQQTSTKGESGEGDQPKDAQGSPDSQQGMKPGEKRQQNGSGENASNNSEPPSGGRGKRESDSQGGQGGDRTGGGEEGGGQKANREGTGSSGQNQSADEGAGESSEQGAGNNSQSAGEDAASTDRTGQKGSDQRGQGSSQREGQGDQPGGKPGDSRNQESGGDTSPTDANNQTNSGEPASAGGQQQSKSDSNSRSQNSGDKANNSQQQSGQFSDGPPTGDATGVPQGAGQPPPANGNAPEADAANLDYARKQTNLVLESLADQLRRKKVDKQMLDELGWSDDDLQRFIDRWTQLKESANGKGPEADAARRELNDALRSLGLHNGPLQQSNAPDDNVRNLRQGYRGPVPLEYQERLRAYNQGVSRSQPDDE